MKTIVPIQIKWNERKWYLIDAQGQTLWKLASKVAPILRGKNKAYFTPHLDNGDYVIITNCDKFVVSWKKLTDKVYYTHSGFLWGLKETSLEKLLEKKPNKALELAVFGMLPKNKLRKDMISRLKLFTTDEHSFVAQKPVSIK